jgi:hypothetical protein
VLRERFGRGGDYREIIMHRIFLTLLLLGGVMNRAVAEEVRARGLLHLNGYTHHFDAPDANDNLFGLGATWYVKRWGRVARAWETDLFQDSGSKLSGYVGHSWTYRRAYVNVGVTGALMYHRNFEKQNAWRVLPVGLPYAELPLRHFSMRAYYIPPVRNHCDHQIALQVLVPFSR